MRILVSPVGDTDPVRGGFDGPMLHIMRHMQPDVVYIVLMEEMEKKAKADNRFERTAKWISPDCTVMSVCTGIRDAHSFDAFMVPLRELFGKIGKEYPEAEILVNITSGTPQIGANLCLWAVTSEQNITPVQVKTPVNRSNRGISHLEEFDESFLEESLDNLDEAENRCILPEILSFRKAMYKSRVITLINNYDYNAAFALLKGEKRLRWPEGLSKALEHVYLRSQMKTREELTRARKLAAVFGEINVYPVSFRQAEEVIEYYLIAKLKQQRGELPDFLLKLSPLFQSLLEDFLSLCFRFEVNKVVFTDNKGVRRINSRKLQEADGSLYQWLLRELPGGEEMFRKNYLNSVVLLKIIEFFIVNQTSPNGRYTKLLENFKTIRALEENIRNKAAHTITGVSEESLMKTCGKNSAQLCTMLEETITSIYGNHVKKEVFSIYQNMNKHMCKLLENF